MPIKYLGSKRTLIPALTGIAQALEPATAVDLFTGTTRVAQAFKGAGVNVTACDLATYAEVFAQCYIATDATQVNEVELTEALADLSALPGKAGFFTEEYCVKARYLQPHNGARVDAIREELAANWVNHPLYPVLLTSLIEAADRVDSTVGLQMAYLKQWAKRSYAPLELRRPELLRGPGQAVRGDATQLVQTLPATDLMYLDPPYNQHSYAGNYHLWQSLVVWDKMAGYGIANKRLDVRDPDTKSVFNKKNEINKALAQIIQDAKANSIVVSFNNEGWVGPEAIEDMLVDRGMRVARLDFDFKRHVGAKIGIHNLLGEKVGTEGASRNIEHVFVASHEKKATAKIVEAFPHALLK